MFVSLTRLRIRSPFVYPLALIESLRAARVAMRSDGFEGGSLFRDKRRALWTATAWRDQAAMTAYRDGPAHRRLMPLLANWCDEASVAHWTQEDAVMLDWLTLAAQMRALGRASRVKRPSPDHQALTFADPAQPGTGRATPLIRER